MKRAELCELLQTRFGMRLDGVQEGGAKKQEEQKELKWKDEWEEWDLEETVEPVVYQPNCMRCDEWGVGVDCIGSGDSRRVISREPICFACGAIAHCLKQRIVTGNQERVKRLRARNRRNIATEEFDDLGFAIAKEPFCALEDTADSPIACIKDAECEETMATQGHSNQDVEFDPVEFRHQTEEWLDEGVPVVW